MPSNTQGKPWEVKGQLTLLIWPAQGSSLQDMSRALDHTVFLTQGIADLLELTDLLLQVGPLSQQRRHYYEVEPAGNELTESVAGH